VKSRRITLRLSDADFERLRSEARDHGTPVSEYARALLIGGGRASPPPDSRDDDRLARLETLALAAAVSAYEAQITARAALTTEQSAKLKEHRAAQFAAWRAWGVKAAFLGADMRPKATKESSHE
jgi:hypothetical protein